MEAIIRTASVSAESRQLRRRPGRPAATAPLAAPAATVAAPAIAAAPVLRSKPPASPLPHVSAADIEAHGKACEAEFAALRLKAAQELASARAEAEQELASAHADAERRGYAAGEEKGERAATELMQAQIDRFKSLASQLNLSKLKVLDDAEDAVVEIAFAAICRVLGGHAASRDTVLGIVREAAAAVRDREQVLVRLHHEDLSLLSDYGDVPELDVRLVADQTVRLGGCIVDSSTGSLDARIETQVARLGEALRAARAARQQDEKAV